MAKYIIEDSTLQSIADKIRSNTATTEAIAVLDMADKIDDVYNKGELDGQTEVCDALLGGAW